MSIEEDTINPIVNFIHKLLGNNLWILPVSIAIASWIIWYFYPEKHGEWWLLYVAIICSLIAMLHICSVVFIWIKNTYNDRKKNKAAKNTEIKRCEQELATREQKKREHASYIWKFVAHLDDDVIKAATLFLSLGIHDEDKCIRYVKIPSEEHYEERKHINIYFQIIQRLTFTNGYRSSCKMITDERVNNIIYFYIEPYFLCLIEHYQKTKKWEKL